MSIKPREASAIKAIVTEAIQNGQADIITKKMVVKALLSRLDLSGDHFDKEQRNTIAITAKEVLDAYDAAEAKKASGSSPAKRSSPVHPSTSKAVPMPSSPPPVQTKGKVPKSKAVISDSEDDRNPTPQKTKTMPQKAAKPASTKKTLAPEPVSKGKKRKSNDAFRSAEFINSEGDPITASQAGVTYDDASEEEQPKKKSKGSTSKDATKPAAAQKKAPDRKRAASADPDESELKKLKQFMQACEAKQVWGKVFPKLGLNDTKSQIRYLRSQLKELGMPSRMSMEAAKTIGAKRALEKEARELGIDLDADKSKEDDQDEESQEQQSRANMSARPKRAAALRRPPPKQRIKLDSEDESEEEGTQTGGDSGTESTASKEETEDSGGSGGSSSSEAGSDEDDDEEPAKTKSKVKKAAKSKRSRKAASSSDEASEPEDEDDDE